jgi:lipoprotein-anchoring transpeptidase ErfK/SrfK
VKGRRSKLWKIILWNTLIVLFILLFFPILLFVVPWLFNVFLPGSNFKGLSETGEALNSIKKLKTEIVTLNKKAVKLEPTSPYMVINTTENRFMLYKNKKLIREGLCSTGSLISLEGEGNKKWVFKTPRGIHKILSKQTDPVWKKPDWAFVEEGLPVPSPNHPSRIEPYVLGAYALHLRDGYMIHGTIYKRFIGMPVTHGCVRLLDDDLEAVYKTLQIGSMVYIY